MNLLTIAVDPIGVAGTTAARDAVHPTPTRNAFLDVTHGVRHILSSDLTMLRGGLPADGPRGTGGVIQ